MTTINILGEHSISLPDGKSVAAVIYCESDCGCLYLFYSPLSESELRQEEAWRTRADVRCAPPTGRYVARTKQQLVEQFPQALVLRSLCCISLDAPDVFSANACGYCSSLTDHRDGCPGPLEERLESGVAAMRRAWYYGYRMGRAGRWNGFIARVYRNSVRVRLGYDSGKKDLEYEGPLSSY